jgi:hypothetical protein
MTSIPRPLGWAAVANPTMGRTVTISSAIFPSYA